MKRKWFCAGASLAIIVAGVLLAACDMTTPADKGDLKRLPPSGTTATTTAPTTSPIPKPSTPTLPPANVVETTGPEPTATQKPSPTAKSSLPAAKLMGSEVADALRASNVAPPPPPTAVLVSPTAIVGQSFVMQLPAFGGRPPYKWELISGSLPVGLSIDPSGIISGVPNKNDHYVATLVLKDAEGTEVSQSVKITAAKYQAPVTSAGEGGPRIVVVGVAPLTITEMPARKASISVIMPSDFNVGRYVAFRPAIQGGEPPWSVRAVGLPKSLTCEAASGLIQGDAVSLTESTRAELFLRTANGLEAQTSFTLKPSPAPVVPSGGGGGGGTAPAVDVSKQYIEVWVSPSTYGVADIWIDGRGPYRQQVNVPASVGVHTVRIQTYADKAGYSRTLNARIDPGRYWSYQMK